MTTQLQRTSQHVCVATRQSYTFDVGAGLYSPVMDRPGRFDNQGTKALVGAAALIIIIAGLKASATLLVPIVVAIFLSLLAVPPMRWLQARGLPAPLAIAVVMLVATVIVLLITGLLGQSVSRLQDQLPLYRSRLDAITAHAVGWLHDLGVKASPEELSKKMGTGEIMDLVAATASGLVSAMSNVFLVIFTMIFALLEASGFRRKLALALGKEADDELSEWSRISEQVQRYLAIKAQVSLATGILVVILCLAVGVDFPFLWGLVAFLFNFVPNIGSIIAAVPACLLAVVQLGLGPAAILTAGYVAINLVIGNIVEPRLMGRRLGLSTLVVFVSLLFWGWVWGPVGMLLSVPLTVIVKIVLEHSEEFRWLSILLGPGDDTPPRLPKTAEMIAPEPPEHTD